jgi:hypothetical protein
MTLDAVQRTHGRKEGTPNTGPTVLNHVVAAAIATFQSIVYYPNIQQLQKRVKKTQMQNKLRAYKSAKKNDNAPQKSTHKQRKQDGCDEGIKTAVETQERVSCDVKFPNEKRKKKENTRTKETTREQQLKHHPFPYNPP